VRADIGCENASLRGDSRSLSFKRGRYSLVVVILQRERSPVKLAEGALGVLT